MLREKNWTQSFPAPQYSYPSCFDHPYRIERTMNGVTQPSGHKHLRIDLAKANICLTGNIDRVPAALNLLLDGSALPRLKAFPCRFPVSCWSCAGSWLWPKPNPISR